MEVGDIARLAYVVKFLREFAGDLEPGAEAACLQGEKSLDVFVETLHDMVTLFLTRLGVRDHAFFLRIIRQCDVAVVGTANARCLFTGSSGDTVYLMVKHNPYFAWLNDAGRIPGGNDAQHFMRFVRSPDTADQLFTPLSKLCVCREMALLLVAYTGVLNLLRNFKVAHNALA